MTQALVPRAAARALASLDKARQQIALAREAGDVTTLREWRDRAAAMQHYARTRDEARALADDAGEVKVRAERALGQLDAEARPHGGDRSSLGDPSLLDIATDTRAAWRKIGRLTETQFTRVVRELRDDDMHGVTTANVASLAREYLPQNGGRRTSRSAPSNDSTFHDDAQLVCPQCGGTGRVPLEAT